MATKKLTPLEALLQIQGERQDVQKALAPSLYQVGKKMGKKGKKAAWGSFIGQYALPFMADMALKYGLNVVAPGMGGLYAALKKVPAFKAAGKGALAGYGAKIGGEFAAGQVGVPDAEKLMQKYLGETASGEKAMRFGRGAVESIEGQKELQLEKLMESIGGGAVKTGLKTAGSSLLGDLSDIRRSRLGTEAGGGASDILSDIRKGKGDLSAEDYISALREGGKEDIKGLFDISPVKEELAKGRLFQTGAEARRFAGDISAGGAGDYETWAGGGQKIEDTSFMFDDLSAPSAEEIERFSKYPGAGGGTLTNAERVMGMTTGGGRVERLTTARTPAPFDPKFPTREHAHAAGGRLEAVSMGPTTDYPGLFEVPAVQQPELRRTRETPFYAQPMEYAEGGYFPPTSPTQEEIGLGMENLGLTGAPSATAEQLDPSIAQTGRVAHPYSDILNQQAMASRAPAPAAYENLFGLHPPSLGQERQPLGYETLMSTLKDVGMARGQATSGFRQQPFDFLNYLNQPGQGKFGTGFLPSMGGNWRGY